MNFLENSIQVDKNLILALPGQPKSLESSDIVCKYHHKKFVLAHSYMWIFDTISYIQDQ